MVHHWLCKWWIVITEEELKETFEIETSSMEDTEMLESINDSLRFLLRRCLLSLHFNHEAPQMRRRHEPVLGVPVEEIPYLRRRLRHGELESPAAAEANSVSLFGHRSKFRFSSLHSVSVSVTVSVVL